jgi:hypothetical protein
MAAHYDVDARISFQTFLYCLMAKKPDISIPFCFQHGFGGNKIVWRIMRRTNKGRYAWRRLTTVGFSGRMQRSKRVQKIIDKQNLISEG